MSLGFYYKDVYVESHEEVEIDIEDVLDSCDDEDILNYLRIRGGQYSGESYVLRYLKDEWLKGPSSDFDWDELFRYINK